MAYIDEDECTAPILGLDGKPYRWMRDPAGGFLKATPTPSSHELRDFYEGAFYSSRGKFNDSAKENRDRDRDYINWMLADVVEQYERANGRGPETALDLGCGFGHVLDFLLSRGVVTKGYEVSAEAVDHCRRNGHSMGMGIAEDLLASEEQTFDLLTVYNVLEHVTDPHAFLRAALTVTNPRGLIYIQVPNDFSPLQQLARFTQDRDPWWFCPPMHLNYFSVQSLRRTLSVNGWEPVVVWADFPMEVFLLTGQDYLSDQTIGSRAHSMRIDFERRIRESGNVSRLTNLYAELASIGIGREIRVLASPRIGASIVD
jgi:SAM-dependent methyltransferase